MITRGLRPVSKRSRSDALLISVVTVVLNGRDKIEKTIAGVSGQGFKNVQHIVIDGGSTDGTIEKLKKLRKHIDYCVSEPDRGISDAFNKGIAQAKGNLIGILNAGDWYEPNALQMVAEAHRAHPEAEVLCGGLRFWERGEPTIVAYSNPSLLEKETSVYHPAVFITRSTYEKHGLYDEGFHLAMDYELLFRFKRRGAHFLPVPAVLANMSLDGVSYRHWYVGLREVRAARSRYFSAANVATYHSVAVLKNLLAFALKKSGLGILYRAHWRFRNKRMAQRISGAGRAS
jgi:glycosyltransferase involved in cell wall biosynthesis